MKTGNVLVTGGKGFIGSHTVAALVEHGYAVTVLDDLSTGNWRCPSATFVEGSVMDLPLLRRLCSENRDGVFHLAARSRVLPTLSGDMSAIVGDAEINILGTINVMIAAAEARVAKVVYSASSTRYGNHPPPHTESMASDCFTPYAISKDAGERYLLQFGRQFRLPVVSLRYFQVYGPRQPSAGPYAVVVGLFLDQKKRGEALTIHGDGSQRRDFVHVDHVAHANVLALEKEVDGEAINVGTGVSHSIKELADMISSEQRFSPKRDLDLQDTRADTDLSRAMLGWVPPNVLRAWVGSQISCLT